MFACNAMLPASALKYLFGCISSHTEILLNALGFVSAIYDVSADCGEFVSVMVLLEAYHSSVSKHPVIDNGHPQAFVGKRRRVA